MASAKQTDPKDVHDREIFIKLDGIADEDKLMWIFRSLKDQHRIFDSQQDVLDKVLEFLKRTKHRFLTKELADTAAAFVFEMDVLMEILLEFDSWPYHQNGPDYKSELMPGVMHWTGFKPGPEERKKYNELSAKLVDLDSTVINAYALFRMEVKKRLFI